jgi:hypothetical protein
VDTIWAKTTNCKISIEPFRYGQSLITFTGDFEVELRQDDNSQKHKQKTFMGSSIGGSGEGEEGANAKRRPFLLLTHHPTLRSSQVPDRTAPTPCVPGGSQRWLRPG